MIDKNVGSLVLPKVKFIFQSLLFLIFLGSIGNAYAQQYNVSSYQKINESVGNFLGTLNSGDSFGVSIENIGDLDGNGINDLAVGAFGDDDGGSNRGAVYILFLGEEDTVVSFTKISSNSGGFSGPLSNSDAFGGAVSFLGDLNGDGLIELAVGADYDGDGGYWHGAVWILSLNTDGTVDSHSKISGTQGGFTGNVNGGGIFGTDIENIGDLNGDGIDDLAVGSRRDDDGGLDKGAVWILFMNNDFTVNDQQKISATEGNFTANLSNSDYFGGSVANIGDLNGDGVVDIAVGAYRDNDGNYNAGSIYILFLNVDGTVNSHQKISNTQGGFGATLDAEALFGESIDGLTDIDQDGKKEIVVGAMRAVSANGIVYGGFYIVELNSNGTVSEQVFYTSGEFCFFGDLSSQELFGGSVTFLSEDEENIKIAVGAYRDSDNSFTQKGAVWILNLGESDYSDFSFTDPTNCNAEDGTILFDNLKPNSSFMVTYWLDGQEIETTVSSNSDGQLIIANLGSGTYGDVLLLNVSSGCTVEVEQITLSDSNAPNYEVEVTHPSECAIEDGGILLIGLNPDTSFTTTYLFEGQEVEFTAASNSNGEIYIPNLGQGIYSNILVLDNNTGCSVNIEEVVLNGGDSNSYQFELIDPSGCGMEDGIILFTNLEPNIAFTLFYSFEGQQMEIYVTSDENGEVMINNLGAGSYNNIQLLYNSSNCEIYVQDLHLSSPPLIEISGIPNLSNCSQTNDFAIFDLTQQSEYFSDFQYNFFQTLEDAENDENRIINPSDFQSVSASQVIYVRFESDGCYGVTNFELESENCQIFIPQGYSPNGDNYNDVFEISGLYEVFPNFELVIYSKLGNMVYSGNYHVPEWDGTSNTGINSSGPLPTGTYYYVLNLNDPDYDIITGWVYLNR